MSKKKKIFLTIIALIALVSLYLLTYVPHKIININYENVSKIEIFDGGQGKSFVIIKKDEIKRVISNLNSVTFNKDKCSIGYMGCRFRTTIYKKNGKKYKELIINSNDTIRYNGFFYKDKSKRIDYDYLDSLSD